MASAFQTSLRSQFQGWSFEPISNFPLDAGPESAAAFDLVERSNGIGASDEPFEDEAPAGSDTSAHVMETSVDEYDPQYEPRPKTLMMFYKRLREIDVPEMMASIITQTPGQPWNYYRDLARQCLISRQRSLPKVNSVILKIRGC